MRQRRIVDSFVAQTLAFIVLAASALLTLEVVYEYQARQTAIENAERETANLARSLAQHAESTVQIADSVLTAVAAKVEADGFEPTALEALRSMLARQMRQLPRLRHVFVYDEAGNWMVTSLANPPTGLNNSDRIYFRHHQTSDDPEPFIGPPIKSRSEGQWIVTVSRRLEHPDGSFAGVVLATIDAAYFSAFYANFDVGEKGSIGLVRADGILLARMPWDEAAIGRDLSDSALFREMLPRSPRSAYSYTSPIDGVRRISGYQRIERLPLVAIAAVGQEEALRDWRAGAVLRVGAVAVLTAMMLASGFAILRQAKRRKRAEIALSESEETFRMLTESSSDLVTRIGRDGARRYVSPSSTRLLGWPPGDLVGRSAFDTIHPDDRERVREAADRLRGGEVEAITVDFRMLRREGTAIWVETALRVMHDPKTGDPDGVVAITRDVQERKRVEAELSTLATTDELTGLANRRAFDTALGEAWRVAHEQRTPLSLLLIDLDRFKLFNDTYGHPMGDTCLAKVARALKATVARPGDVVARYGGEELAVLLPATDPEGAAAIAAKLREAIAREAIPHPKNNPSGLVTASFGIATDMTSGHGDPTLTPASLVAAADAALYAAKHAGRDRAEAAPVLLTRAS